MKRNKLVFALIIAGITANAVAAPTPKPPPAPQDVNVVNTPTVTVTNPQTSVTVNNSSANPVPVTVQNQSSGCSDSQFVGFSTSTFDGGQGIVTYTNACQQDYPGSLMCTSEVFMNTSNFPTMNVSDYAWIRPSFQPTSNSDPLDISGIAGNPITLTCDSWANNGGLTGLSVNGVGQFRVETCSLNTLHIACCAPLP